MSEEERILKKLLAQ